MPRENPNAGDITLYGITHCDTVKRARAWLAERERKYTFHDYKKQGVPTAHLKRWIKELGWESLVNRRGTTWRKLDAKQQAAVHDAASASALMIAQPSVIRRPVVEWANGTISAGFEAREWEKRVK